ncbi:RluA family pseudouridine synthase [Pelagicoccus sp. SDUM812005]|uniref:RluA family pseudouridine synthase n=1 Tax=Pelagicoccus sp. SDUM812005 TaxID=3041257 RepID=UPI00280E88EE|nr:RluA family pseudouridine synthase [Pelagicoccus sp. SDUM812005]MDQ8179295.1 RluA family pseudouridine synthase [Pelagicoccus sp. SDUM812005]
MSETISWEVPEGVYKARVDKMLSEAFPDHSRSDFQRAFEAGLVLVDGKPIEKKTKLSEGDVVEFSMPRVEKLDMSPIDMDLDIVFEDEHMVVVNKPAGLVVHPGAGPAEPTLAHGLLHHCAGQLSGIGGVERPGIVHRLDRETSGLIMAAKTDVAHRALSELFQSRSLIKEYLALACGVPELMGGTVERPIERNPNQRHKMRVGFEGRGRAREAKTDWTLVKAFEDKGYCLLRCRIHTGRTHQIRVHLKSIRHIILGDTVYGYKPLPKLKQQPERVMLHSCYLKFVHPLTQAEMELEAKLPADFQSFL